MKRFYKNRRKDFRHWFHFDDKSDTCVRISYNSKSDTWQISQSKAFEWGVAKTARQCTESDFNAAKGEALRNLLLL